MISASDVRSKISGENARFDEVVSAVADYLVDEIADGRAHRMISARKEKYEESWEPDKFWKPVLNKSGVGSAQMSSPSFKELKKRSFAEANERIRDAGFKGGFREVVYGEPFYGGGSGYERFVELELEC